MLRRVQAAAIVLVAGPGLTGVDAQEVVVPRERALVEATSFTGFPLCGQRGRHQIVISAAHLAPLGDPWGVSEIWFRRDTTHTKNGSPVGLSGGSIELEVFAGATAAPAEGPSDRFAANRGPGFARVFAGTLVVPDVGAPAVAPAPWTAPHAVRLGFDRRVSGGRQDNLLVEFVVRQSVGRPEPGFWIVDEEWHSSPGMVIPFGSSCSRRFPYLHASARDESLRPGSSTKFTLGSCPPWAVAVHFLGSSDTTLAGQALLPLPLDAVGAPGCVLYTDPFHVTAQVTDPERPGFASETRLWFHVPPAAELHGLPFFSQWLVADAGANALGLSTSNGVRMQLSSGPATTGVAIVANQDLAAASGGVLTHLVPVMRLVR